MAVFALLSSLFSFVCFFGVGGVLGIVLGLIARSEVTRALGREGGRRLANAAVVLGVLNLCLTGVGLVAGFGYLTKLSHPLLAGARRGAPTMPGSPALPIPSPRRPSTIGPRAGSKPQAEPREGATRSSRESGIQVTQLGRITIADISGDFASELAKQRTTAEAQSEPLVLWLVTADCKPCDGVAAALSQPAAQKALAKVRFVRVDRDEFQPELVALGAPTDKIPGFALLDGHDHARDFIHGGEWDADIADNIVPVLARFARGRYLRRRYPWRGAARDDETPI